MPSPALRALAWWISLSRSRTILILAAGAALMAAALPFIMQLRIDTDLARLLPEDLPEVRAMETLRSRLGDLGYFSVVIEGDDVPQMVRFAGAMEKKLGGSPWIRTIVYRNPVDLVRRYAYLWIPADKLARIGDSLEKKHCEANPFCVSLDEEDGGAAASDAAGELQAFRSKIRPLDTMPELHLSPDGKILAMRLRPGPGVASLDDVRAMRSAIETAISSVRGQQPFPSVRHVLVGGSLKKRLDEYETVRSDVSRCGLLSCLLIVLLLAAALRNGWGVAAAAVPLLLGLAATFLITALTVGSLNTVTSLLFAVIFGLGIDAGLHLVMRYRAMRSSGTDPGETLRTIGARTGKAILVASLTTAGGFFIMMASGFKGFSHLGFIAGIGILCTTLSYLMLFPAMTALAERFGSSLQPLAARPGAGLSLLFSGRGALPAAALSVIVIAAGALCLGSVSFNYDFDSLGAGNGAPDPAAEKQGQVYTKTLTPGGVVFAPDEKAALEVAEAFEKKMMKPGSVIGGVLGASTFIPQDQAARLEELRRIGGLVTPALLASVDDPDLRRDLEGMKTAAGLAPLTPAALPPEAREMLLAQGRGGAWPVFVFGKEKLSDGRAAMRFQEEAGAITAGGRSYVATGGAIIYAAVMKEVVRHGPPILLASLGLIALVVIVQMRSLAESALALLPLVQGLALLAAVMAAFHVELNIYNVAILGAVVGMGVDYGVYVVSHYHDLPGVMTSSERATRTLRDIFSPILYSWLTTSAGYMGLILSHHPGLRSIGTVALIGLGGCFLMSVTLLPLLLSASAARRDVAHLPSVA
jgi:predicted RND superfamily exporter protein